MADFKLKLGGVDSNELLSALKEMQQGAIEAEKMSESVQANNEKVIKGSTKAAQTAASNISQTVQEVEKAVTKSVDTTIKELKRLNNIDFSIKIGTGKGQKKKSIADDLYPANEDVQNVVKQLNKSKDKIENAISEYHNDIESMRSEMWKYEAKGKSHSKLTQGLFDEKEVDKAYNSFVSTNKEKLQDVKDQLIREREELYSAFNNLQNKTNTVKLGDYSDLSLNKSTLKDMVQMVEIAKMIQRYNNQIGVSDSRYENINVTDLQTKVASIAENMIKKGISKKFGQEVTQLETDANKLIEIIVGMQKGEASAFESLKTFAGNIVTPFKETKNEIQEVAEELKQAKTYIDETKKTATSLSQKKKGDKYSIKATYDKPPELDSVKGGAATERDYIYVGEVTNLLKNDERLESHPGVLYLKKLIEMKPELKSLYDEIMNINKAISQTPEPKKVSVPKDVKNPKVVDGDELATIEAEKKALEEKAAAQEKVNNAKKEEKQINDQINNKFTKMSVDQLLSYDFRQGQKKEATAQLEEAYNAFKDFYGKEEAQNTEAGAKAAYAYYSAYENALAKEVADSRLQKYTLGDYKAEQISASYRTALYSGNPDYIGQSQLKTQKILESFKTASTPSVPQQTNEIREESQVVEQLTNNVKKASDAFKQMTDVKNIKMSSDELYASLTEAMSQMEKMYDAGQTESVEYYATLYKIAEIQKKIWQYNYMGNKSPYDQMSPDHKDASERMSIQDDILKDFNKFSGASTQMVDFVIGEFTRLKNTGEKIFGENGKIIGKQTMTDLVDMLELPYGQINQTSPSSDSSVIVEKNKEVIKSNEEVIASEEKKRKYTIVSRDSIPDSSRINAAKVTQQINQQEADSSTSTTATVVEGEKKQQEAAEKTAKKVEEKAKVVENANKKIVESNKKTINNNNNSGYADDGENWDKITTLHNDYGQDPFAEIKQKAEKTKSSYRTTVEMWGLNKDKEFELQTVKIIEDMGKLAKDTESAEAKIKKAQAAMQNFMATFDNKTLGQGSQLHGYNALSQFQIVNVSDIETASTMMKQLDAEYNKVVQDFRKGSSSMNPFVNAINNTSRMSTMIESLMLDYHGLKVQTTDIGEALLSLDLKYQDLMSSDNIYDRARLFGELKVSINEVTDAIKIQRKEEALSEKYDKENSRALLLNEKKNNKVNELAKLESQLTDSGKMTDEVRIKLDLLFNDLSKASNNTDLSIWNEQLKQFKSSISDLPQTFESAWNETLAKINSKQGLELNRSIGTNSIKKTIEDNVGIGRDSTSFFKDSIKGTEWTGALASDAHDTISQYSSIVSKMKEIIELRKTLRNYENEASKNVNSDYSEYINRTKESISALIGELRILLSDDFIPKNQDILGEGRVKNFINLYDEMEVEQTRIESDRQKRQLENQKQAVIRSVAAQKQIAATFNEALQGYSLDENTAFKNASIDKNGNATLTFLEIIGDKAVETKVHIDDIATALANLQNGTFSVEGYKTSYSTRNVKAEDFSGINQNDQIQAKIDAYKQLYSTEKKYKELEVKVNNNAASSKEKATFEELTKIREYYNKVIAETLKLEKEEQLYYDSIGKASIDKEKDKYEKEQLRQQGKYNAYDNIYKDRINTPEIQNALTSTAQLMKQISAKNQNVSGFSTVFNNAQKEVEELNSALRVGSINTETYTEKIQGIANGLNNVIGVLPSNITDIKTGMEALAKTLPNAEIGTFNGTNNTLQVTLNRGKGIIQELTLGFNQMSGAVNIVKDVTKHTEGTLGNFFKSLKNRGRALVQYLMTFASFYRVVGWVRQGVTVIRELDAALTEMRKVSDESVESLKNFQKVSFDIGNDIGATAAQIQNSAADFMRLGYSLQEAAELAEDANIYANVGDMEIDEATEHMISSIKAWQSEFSSEVEASEAIIDRYNEIGNNFAISSADIGSAMERSAAALKAGGNTLNESLGLITAGE